MAHDLVCWKCGASLAELNDLASTMQTVSGGRNAMPAFSTSLSPEQIRDVSAFVIQSLARRAVQ